MSDLRPAKEAVYPHLEKAPIESASFIVHFRDETEITTGQIQRISELTSARFHSAPMPEELRAVFRPDLPSNMNKQSGEAKGFRFVLNAEEPPAQGLITGRGFVVIVNPPYQDWAHLRKHSRAMLNATVKALSIEALSSYSLRYINKLQLPEGFRDFRDYLTSVPEPPPRLPQVVVEFYSRIVLPLRSEQSFASIAQSFQPSGRNVTLDINCTHVEDLKAGDKKVWSVVEALRQEKNRLFFESITEQMVNLCR